MERIKLYDKQEIYILILVGRIGILDSSKERE